jgi:polysaccharide biosynthesis transport protein
VAEADNRRDAWRRANEEYIQAKTNAGVIDIEESKKHYMTEMDRTAQQLVDTETELAGKEVFVRAMTGTTNIPSHYETLAPTNQSAIVKAQVVPPEVSAEYSDLRDTMNDQKQQLRHLLIEFQPDSPRVQGLRAQISTNEVRRFQLEKDYPSLASVKRNDPMTTTSSAVAAAPKFDLDEEMAQIQALQAKRIVLANYLAKVKADVGTLEQQETRITELAHKVDLAEKAMTDYVTRLDRVHTDERLGAGAASNINPFESPTPPYRAMAGQSKMIKKIGMAVLATFGGTIGLVLLLEFVVNQTVRRASDVEVRLGVPVFLSIPRLGINGNGRSLNDSRPALLLPEHATNGHGPNGNGAAAETPAKSNGKPQDLEMALWDPRHILHPFCEALRDRLINFFEVKNLTHKPKLVTVTGCEEGAGVSSIAAGLAASLSETGDGNVLLVDMNNQGTAQQFYRGDLACGLDEALEISEKRDSAMVQDNLYVVTGQSNNDKLPRALPKRFRHLVPRLRASDFDYIIFDMPPISQTSVTLQLARFMDTVLIVAESEKTDREVLRKATALLNESKTNVGVVLNKSRSYLPKRLQQEL